ncbi:MAG: hypothetical protein IT558_04840, partial [Alphaproteobacteria bacterium]|nr:hypothetical protein [Alphaproteobacteria bacterium]
MILPSWALYGLAVAVLSAAMMLLQERLKVNGYALAFWNKAACLIVAAPFVLVYGAPQSLMFYVYLGLTAVLYAISDVVFFTSIPKTNAGAVSRLIPVGSVFGFLLWFVISPSLLEKYLAAPVISVLIFTSLCLFAFFAAKLKKCDITMATLRNIWFVIFAATVGPLLTKLTTFHTGLNQGIYGYVFFQALMMMVLWLVYLAVKRPVPFADFFAFSTAWRGLLIGSVSSGAVLLKFVAFYYVDNPAYIAAVTALDSVIILL